MRITPHLLLAAAMGLLVLGGWQAGQGLYMTAKAELAQVLLEDAWEETKRTGTHVKAWGWADTWPVARVTAPRVNGDTSCWQVPAAKHWLLGQATSPTRQPRGQWEHRSLPHTAIPTLNF